MSEEKKELKKNLKNEELCEGKQKLSIEELDKVSGGGSSPLYVLDGTKIMTDGFGNINPDDLESIDVLKDASATAIFGARGAN